MSTIDEINATRYFAESLKVSGIPHLGPEKEGDPRLLGKRLGLLNGGSWIVPWANYFGRKFLPGVHLINIGNEAVQLNFMRAHHEGQPTPPQSNIDTFERYARDLVELGNVDAVLITCSTMNRSYPQVQEALAGYGVPVVQIDRPMMEAAVRHGGRVLVIATHGPTVASTQALLRETAAETGQEISFAGVTVHEGWERLADGDVEGHNELIAEAIRQAQAEDPSIASVVLAQLSMTVFLLSFPDPLATFGIPVFTSGQCGFEFVRELLLDGRKTE